MRVVVAVLAVSIIAGSCYGQTDGNQPKEPKRIAFKNGQWFDGHAFKRKDGYAVNGVLTFHRPAQVDETVDLSGQFVVPPFGEAHNHNVEPLNKVDELIKRYIEHGIFYVKNPNNLPSGRDQVAAKINRPESIDVTFSNGGFAVPADEARLREDVSAFFRRLQSPQRRCEVFRLEGPRSYFA
jgi:hypothetical protein